MTGDELQINLVGWTASQAESVERWVRRVAGLDAERLRGLELVVFE